VRDYWSGEWVVCEGASAEDAVIVPRLKGGLIVESPTGQLRALQRVASLIDARPAWVEWNPAT
jgi:hypothetical protein